MSSFDLAIRVVLAHEGGYVRDPDDPGGETNFGISQRWYPNMNVRAITQAEAEAIYRRDFWQYDGIADQAVATKLLDMAVNFGSFNAIRLAQQALADGGYSIVVDGLWGPYTETAVNSRGPAFIQALRVRCAMEYAEIVAQDRSKSKFLLGWVRRAIS